MGMTLYDALVLGEVALRLGSRERVLTLGVPSLNFTANAYYDVARADAVIERKASFGSAADFFNALGFDCVDALDISNYEGANVIGDLNDPGLPDRVTGRYDLIYDSGTIEHIFEITTALRTVDALLNKGGAIVHATPSNGFLDHGFWQVSPDMFRSFYGAGGYSCLTSSVLVLGLRPYSVQADDNIYRTRGRAFIVDTLPEAIAVFAARKDGNGDAKMINLQGYYAAMHGDGKQKQSPGEFFIPFGSEKFGHLLRFPLAARLFLLVRPIWAFVLRVRRGGRRRQL